MRLALIFTLWLALAGSAAGDSLRPGTGTWGGVPGAPNAILIEFPFERAENGVGSSLSLVRQIAADHILAGELCSFSETLEQTHRGSVNKLRLEFKSAADMFNAMDVLKNSLDGTLTQLQAASGPVCPIVRPRRPGSN